MVLETEYEEQPPSPHSASLCALSVKGPQPIFTPICSCIANPRTLKSCIIMRASTQTEQLDIVKSVINSRHGCAFWKIRCISLIYMWFCQTCLFKVVSQTHFRLHSSFLNLNLNCVVRMLLFVLSVVVCVVLCSACV
jgi:hypothetical protein